ncbi:MAG: PIN domain-containing protein [Bacteroidales bacterium]|nr:PIN domain-containing protein [Bacteroidales bacterium]
MKRVFLDTNVLLDGLDSQREQHFWGQMLLSLSKDGAITGITSTQCLVDFSYIYTKGKKVRVSELKELIQDLNNLLTIQDTTRNDLLLAASHYTDDYEDAVLAAVALSADCDVIVTRDKDFDAPFGLPIVSPDEFCREFIEE